jgi:hypothetical protein
LVPPRSRNFECQLGGTVTASSDDARIARWRGGSALLSGHDAAEDEGHAKRLRSAEEPAGDRDAERGADDRVEQLDQRALDA